MSEIDKKKDGLKAKKHTFYSIFKIVLYTINILLGCIYIFMAAGRSLDKIFSMDGLLSALVAVVMIYVFSIWSLLSPIYALYMSLIYIF